MKRLLVLLLVSIFLVACGSTEEEKEVASVEKDDTEVVGDEAEAEESTEAEESNYDEVLIDSDLASVTLESILKVEDETFDEEYHLIKVAIENKSDDTIIVQADEVSADGLMVTDHVIFSEEVSGGKKANGKIQIQTFDEDLPPLDEELEMTLIIIDEESFERIQEEKVTISIK